MKLLITILVWVFFVNTSAGQTADVVSIPLALADSIDHDLRIKDHLDSIVVSQDSLIAGLHQEIGLKDSLLMFRDKEVSKLKRLDSVNQKSEVVNARLCAVNRKLERKKGRREGALAGGAVGLLLLILLL